jgi:hypothetical protein
MKSRWLEPALRSEGVLSTFYKARYSQFNCSPTKSQTFSVEDAMDRFKSNGHTFILFFNSQFDLGS